MNYTEMAKREFTEEQFEEFEERAAILEFDAGFSREEAEKRAYLFVAIKE